MIVIRKFSVLKALWSYGIILVSNTCWGHCVLQTLFLVDMKYMGPGGERGVAFAIISLGQNQ